MPSPLALAHENVYINLTLVRSVHFYTSAEVLQLNETVIKNIRNGRSYIVFKFENGDIETFSFNSDEEGAKFFGDIYNRPKD